MSAGVKSAGVQSAEAKKRPVNDGSDGASSGEDEKVSFMVAVITMITGITGNGVKGEVLNGKTKKYRLE